MMSSYGMSAVNCTDYPPLQSNPDIDGIGVLIGFLATSYLAFICCTVKAILDHERKSAYILGKATKKLDLWSHLLEITIISFSDQQIITGISVIIAGVTQLGWGIDAYHWETVANLAWFSAFTHIITLTALHEDPPNQTIWLIRVIAMGILLAMLTITLYPVGYMLTYTTIPANLPAWCFFHPSLSWYSPDIGYNWLYITLTFSIILFSYSSRVLRLFSVHIPQVMAFIFSRIIPRKIHETLEQVLKKLKLKSMESILSRMNSRHPKYRLLKSIDMVFLAGRRMFTSTYWELTWLLLVLAWGTARIYVTRETGGGPTVDSLTSVLSKAGIWSFGQVVNTVLLVLPLVGFFEAFLDPPDPKILSLGAGSPNNEEARRTEQRLSLPQPTSTSTNETSIKQSIESGEWFKILVVLWYLLALNIGADLIYTFPATNGAQYFTSSGVSLSILVYYIFWILLDIGLLWVPTLIFMDDHRNDTSNEKISTKRLLRVARWGTMGLMFGISVFFDYWIDAQGITWIDNLE